MPFLKHCSKLCKLTIAVYILGLHKNNFTFQEIPSYHSPNYSQVCAYTLNTSSVSRFFFCTYCSLLSHAFVHDLIFQANPALCSFFLIQYDIQYFIASSQEYDLFGCSMLSQFPFSSHPVPCLIALLQKGYCSCLLVSCFADRTVDPRPKETSLSQCVVGASALGGCEIYSHFLWLPLEQSSLAHA